MQLKYCFKKEWMQFSRTFRIWGVILTVFLLALSGPLMFKFTATFLELMSEDMPDMLGAVSAQPTESGDAMSALFGGLNMDDMIDMFSDSGIMFASSISPLPSYGLLAIMLFLMSPGGGEQKKRAMIVPMCSGLDHKNYLMPKFILYPCFTLAAAFVSSMLTGGMCNALFPNNNMSIDLIALTSLMVGVYMAFIVSVFLALGLITSRPGVMAPAIFFGQTFLNFILNLFGLTRFHPFALLSYINSATLFIGDDNVLADELASIYVSLILSVVISVLMYFLTLGVLRATKTDNQEEITPEF